MLCKRTFCGTKREGHLLLRKCLFVGSTPYLLQCVIQVADAHRDKRLESTREQSREVERNMLGWISKRCWATAVHPRIRVFWRTKLSVAVIHPLGMKLEASYSWVFHNLYLLEVKAMSSLIYHRLKAWRLCFSSCHPSRCSGRYRSGGQKGPFLYKRSPIGILLNALQENVILQFFKGTPEKIS